MPGSPDRTSFTPGRVNVSPSDTQGGSRVPELGSLGSVRGALSNGRPYRDLVMPRRAEPEASLEIGNGFSNLECMLWICSAGYKSEGSENRSDQTPRLGRAVGATARFAPGSPRASDRRSEPRKSPQALSSCRCGTFKR